MVAFTKVIVTVLCLILLIAGIAMLYKVFSKTPKGKGAGTGENTKDTTTGLEPRKENPLCKDGNCVKPPTSEEKDTSGDDTVNSVENK